jgi:outer membrane protein assembly factor BamA
MYKIVASIFVSTLFLIGIQFKANAQYRIAQIDIEGNVKTKAYIILRELPYHVGSIVAKDSLTLLNKLAQEQLINTSLFNDATITASQPDSASIKIKIKLTERWYFFPLPYFRWVDRNFSEWWNEQHHSLDRVNYGINIRQSNVTGNNDRLTLGLITGYTQQAVARYQFPYLDKKLKFGMGLGWQYFTQKELNTSTYFDKQVFTKTNADIQNGYRANLNFFYRPNLFERITMQAGYGNSSISDSALLVQPNYFPNHRKSLTYADFGITFSKTKFDYNAYPTQGNSTDIGIFQRFSGSTNLSSFQIRQVYAHRLNRHNFYLIESNSLAKFMANQNYMDSRLMGYGNMQMNGFEYYVIDGNAGSIAKAEWHHLLGSYTLPKKTGFSITDKLNKHLPDIKYHFWLKAFTNMGYAYSEHPVNSSKLSNTLLRSAGIGLDIISVYDLVIKIDYSVNQLGDKGVYLHGGINF